MTSVYISSKVCRFVKFSVMSTDTYSRRVYRQYTY